LLFFLGFAYLYVMWLYRLWRAIKMNPANKYYYEMYFFVLLMFLPTSILPSSIIWEHHYWILFAVINEISHPDNWMPRQYEQI
ncbi:MAG TPA: lipid A-core ligase, partial [Candidatus Cloacimonas sp.]|nr:lipid A-core ligase [Candidatus Cloacimonas sp.]